MIELRGATKEYDGVVAVAGVSFIAEPGTVTGFIGPNGSGKSTTLRMVAGLERPTSGSVTIDGVAYRDHRNPAAEIGVMLDADWLAPRRSAADHLRWLAAGIGVPRGRADEALALVGLQHVADRPAAEYSLGMRQRLAVAGALLGDPAVIVLDEPVNGLDPEAIAWTRVVLRRFAAEGRTVLVSSHLLAELERTADHIVLIDRGRIVADEPLADLLDRHAAPVAAGPPGGLHRRTERGPVTLEDVYFTLTEQDPDGGITGPAAPDGALAPDPRPRPRFVRAVLAELLKARTTPALRALSVAVTVVTLGAAVLVGVFGAGIGHPTVDTALYGFGLLGGALTAAAGALLHTADHDAGTVWLTRLVFPRPALTYAAKALVAAVVALVGVAVLTTAAIGLAILASHNADPTAAVSAPGAEIARLAWTVPVVAVLLALAGLAVGTALRTSAAAVTAVLGWWYVAESVVVPAIPDVGRTIAAWLPVTDAEYAMIGVRVGEITWSPVAAIGIVAVWTAVLTALALWRLRIRA
ncbi:ABC transporter ATP-binding protein [Tsukamurella soli]|uniref:ABC transporter domain-containing protein n=1 Tax=Tsukamurella soli TaxID=644556 RepID=A0ABP8KGA6_9ACTN